MKKFLVAGMLVAALGSACTSTAGTSTKDVVTCTKLQSQAQKADSTNADDMAAIGLSGIVAGTLLEGNAELKIWANELKTEFLTTGDVTNVEAYTVGLIAYCNSL